MLITFEGLDGSGKSTQLQLLADRLSASGFNPLRLREPGGTDWSESIRNVILAHRDHAVNPIAEVLAFFSARAQLMNQVVLPALSTGRIILLDRFVESSLAYQGYGLGLDLGFLHQLAGYATGNRRPDRIIYLDISYADSVARQTGRGQRDRMESMPEERFNRIRDGYHRMAESEPARWIVLNAMQSADVLRDRIWTEIQSLIPVGPHAD